ncbi:class I SAM-dependent methyltransferase [Salinimicrobium terrae]|uniref:class I SAM-dependent methyltransferase n=1 Tax=Salinimicrobium terrae TaxID=470866 RepID=UPI000419211A|nr:class I SAM-dependent methyltransferase [Salinimicrobium terrae]
MKDSELKHNAKKSDDTYSMAILQPLLINLPYLPFNGGALRPMCIAYILNEIIINQRKMILEFGSGLSTILMARLIKRNNLGLKIITVEHNKEWATVIDRYLKNEDLQQYVKIIQADLKEIETPLGKVNWYNYQTVLSGIENKKFDLITVDGPPANGRKIRYSRFPAFTKITEFFQEDYCLLLDDANRKGEQKIIKSFQKFHPDLHFEMISETLAVFRKTNSFNPIPIQY